MNWDCDNCGQPQKQNAPFFEGEEGLICEDCNENSKLREGLIPPASIIDLITTLNP